MGRGIVQKFALRRRSGLPDGVQHTRIHGSGRDYLGYVNELMREHRSQIYPGLILDGVDSTTNMCRTKFGDSKIFSAIP